MSKVKKYYWLKLQDNFFDREEIKIIEATKNGKDYIIFYLKLILKSIRTEGFLVFRDTIPYSPEMLATITNTNIDTVNIAVDMFIKLKLMERWREGVLYMNETQLMIGSETDAAERKRKQRNAQKRFVTMSHSSHKLSQICSPEIEIDLHKQKDLDINNNNLSPKNKNFSFAIFKKKVLSKYKGKTLVNGIPGLFLPTTEITLTEAGFLNNSVTGLDLTPDDAIMVWKYLYKNPHTLNI
ncbi:MAG: phage replisome organizer N-terminal domain-containing protein [Sulfurospirillaceae bacterium]|nr:phage replisome organizer N-terminal domain-containing protein [Sulfurospirillaceae bacterium]MDD2827404.1 phage replisome organizer N-terminal domain-containing protein [Sulfurospirillaceae bacterium]